MDENIIAILKNFGWTEGFKVPVANEENKILESNAEKIYEKRMRLKFSSKQYEDRLNLVTYYLNNAVEERRHYQEIHSACKEQRTVETSLCKSITAEKQVVRAEKIKILKKKKQLFEDHAGLQLRYEKLNEKVEEMKNSLDWGKELESTWIEFTNSGNERIDLLEKWQLKNISKLEQVETERLKLVTEKDEYEVILRQKCQNILDAECSLKKLTNLQQTLRKERIHLIAQWERLVQVITSRDNEITRLSEEMNTMTEISINLKNKITEKKHFLDEQIRNNIRINIDIRREEIQVAHQTVREQNLNTQLEHLESKINDCRIRLFSLKVEILKKRTHIANTREKLARKTNTVSEMSAKNDQATKTQLQTKALYHSVEERTKELVRVLQDEKITSNELLLNCKKFDARLQNQRFSLTDCDHNLKSFDYEIKELRRAKIGLENDNQRCKQQIERQMDIFLDLKHRLSELAKHMQYVKGDKINQLVNEQKEELANVTAFFNYHMKIFDQVINDLECFQREIMSLEKSMACSTEQIKVLQSDKEKCILQMDGNEKRLIAMIELNRQKLVSENVSRTRVDCLEIALLKNGDKMLDLRKQKIEINVVVRKHNFEIQAASNILRNSKKLTNQEISSIKHHIEQVRRRIHQQMKRYEIIVDGIKKDDSGVPLNVTNYKIQMTKERCALLEKGDELDVLVRKAEKEIQAMENTLTLLNVSNNVYKRNSSNGDHNANDIIKYKDMKQQKIRLSKTLEKIEQMAEKTRNEISHYHSVLSIELLSKLGQLKHTKGKKETDYAQICRTVNEQSCKINRVKDRIKKVKKTLKINHINAQVLEREFFSRELLKLNKRVLQRITQLTSQHNELETSVHQHLITKGISLP
ncbi:coiled-coil domain-containing protein 39-like [Planococcus citri]|uniref:coiled-coil domain-containing protein 39-like n=1 Tax=Planococcus citri TaxID=170843 RepID=UPI0031F88D8F